jgi:hypothetical protein
MCDERERLIDYLYEACDANERRRVEDHLASCEECCEEIGGLRRVRLDLLGWEVPDHGSVWKPFAPVRPAVWWKEVPAWALAAAASVMFLLGIAGGLVARQLAPAQVAAAAVPTLSSPIPTLQPAPVLTQADLTSLERRIATTVQGQLEARLQPMAAHPVPAGLSEDKARALVQVLLGESESRQAQAVRVAVLKLLSDSDSMFVKKTTYNTFLNTDLRWRIQQEVGLALQQQQGGNK